MKTESHAWELKPPNVSRTSHSNNSLSIRRQQTIRHNCSMYVRHKGSDETVGTAKWKENFSSALSSIRFLLHHRFHYPNESLQGISLMWLRISRRVFPPYGSHSLPHIHRLPYIPYPQIFPGLHHCQTRIVLCNQNPLDWLVHRRDRVRLLEDVLHVPDLAKIFTFSNFEPSSLC